MDISEKEILEIKKFIVELNEQTDSVIVVEGKRDAQALKKLGFTGVVVEFHKFGGLTKFSDEISKYQNVIMLLDGDKKGRYLTAKIIEQLQRRTKIDLSFKKKLISITKGKIRFIEQLTCYESYLV